MTQPVGGGEDGFRRMPTWVFVPVLAGVGVALILAGTLRLRRGDR